MASGRVVRLAAVLGVIACTGCVDRRFIIESNVPNAQVSIDNKPIGAAPAYSSFEYYGNYTVTLVQPGYETLVQRVHVGAPWYAYPPFDFIAEVLWPFHIHDTRRYYFQMHEAAKNRTDDLLNNADALRLRGWNLPSPEHPALPKPPAPKPIVPADNRLPFPQPADGGILPPPTPQPGPVPQVGP